jgi:hypothetical protein
MCHLPSLLTVLTPTFSRPGAVWSVKLGEKLFDQQSAFQWVTVHDTPSLGRVLSLDGIIQAREPCCCEFSRSRPISHVVKGTKYIPPVQKRYFICQLEYLLTDDCCHVAPHFVETTAITHFVETIVIFLALASLATSKGVVKQRRCQARALSS